MGSLTIEVRTWDVGVVLREEFAVPASIEPADYDRLVKIMAEIRKVKERVAQGDTRIYSEVFGCWIRVIEG